MIEVFGSFGSWDVSFVFGLGKQIGISIFHLLVCCLQLLVRWTFDCPVIFYSKFCVTCKDFSVFSSGSPRICWIGFDSTIYL